MSPSSRYWSPQAAVNFISADNLHLNCHILYYPPITLLWRVFLQLYSLYFYILCFIFQYLEIQIIILHSFGHHFFILLGGLLAPTSSSKGPKPICLNFPLVKMVFIETYVWQTINSLSPKGSPPQNSSSDILRSSNGPFVQELWTKWTWIMDNG